MCFPAMQLSVIKCPLGKAAALLRQMEHNLAHQNIHHTTIQLETPAYLSKRELGLVSSGGRQRDD
ncbi:MAG: hypothetical protein RQM92_12065 [Candidatus Syntrophopropionicum ammoniitolerans]